MGRRKLPPKAKLVIGLLLQQPSQLEILKTLLEPEFGPIEDIGLPNPFTDTDYYAKELGPKPWRAFLGFTRLIDRHAIGPIKIRTNSLEEAAAIPGSDGQLLRTFNLDPGCLTLGQFFLATTKDQKQRVYIGDGIYVEPTLYFQNKEWQPFPWTYPSYRSGDYFAFLTKARESLSLANRSGV
jgi:hypothetical protein